jgi:hypothetical protein
VATQISVRESLAALHVAIGEDATEAVCSMQQVRRSFAAAIGEMSVRTGRLEASLAEVERATPLLLPFDEPGEDGRKVRAVWVRLFWAILAVLCLSALAGGFLAGKWWGR